MSAASSELRVTELQAQFTRLPSSSRTSGNGAASGACCSGASRTSPGREASRLFTPCSGTTVARNLWSLGSRRIPGCASRTATWRRRSRCGLPAELWVPSLADPVEDPHIRDRLARGDRQRLVFDHAAAERLDHEHVGIVRVTPRERILQAFRGPALHPLDALHLWRLETHPHRH